MADVKKQIKKLLIGKAECEYSKMLESKKMDYNKWIQAVEQQDLMAKPFLGQKVKCQTIDTDIFCNDGYMEECDRKLAKDHKLCNLICISDERNKTNCETQYLVADEKCLPNIAKTLKNRDFSVKGVILKIFEGEFSELAFLKINSAFEKNKSLIMIYADEDVSDESKRRSKPWFKPDFSPDLFLSFFYFGSFAALRSDTVLKCPPKKDENIYDYLYRVLLSNNAFGKHDKEEVVGHIPEILYHTKEEAYPTLKGMMLKETYMSDSGADKDDLISVVIPSKDHPDILRRCIETFVSITECEGFSYEFIVVDNGSSSENAEEIKRLSAEFKNKPEVSDFIYDYEKAEFNFSRMCNRGASLSKGSFILFLNDDIEIRDKSWLGMMYEKAALPYSGCVGAKLIYPEETMKKAGIKKRNVIQHAGITNLRIGPAHKLQFLSDDEDHYYGRNRYCHDMMGVTGACLLIKRDIFNEVGGFDENLAVAFNDVDLCYSVYELGYYNIERNDTFLLHHESLSRGNDADSSLKMQRLANEKDYLYRKHQKLYGKDPFYNVNLTTDMLESEYAPKYHYEVKLDMKWAGVKKVTDVITRSREDKCLRVGMESAMDIYKWKYGVMPSECDIEPTEDDFGYYFQGYTFVTGSNNACFERMLLLRNEESLEIYGIDVNIEYRPDIKNNLSDQLNVDLTGYTAKLKAGLLPHGTYRFGMYMKDRTSLLRLHNWSNWTLEV